MVYLFDGGKVFVRKVHHEPKLHKRNGVKQIT